MDTFWCWTEGEPSTFRCRERGHDVRETSPGGLIPRAALTERQLADAERERLQALAERDEERGKRDDLIERYQQVCNDYIKLQNENSLLLAKLDRQRVNAQLALRIIDRVRSWHSPSFYPDETGLCGGCGEEYPCHTRRLLEGEATDQQQPGVPSGYHCPDHPGPLDDAEGHVCRLRPDPCLCGADLGSPWGTTPHRKGTRGCRSAS